MVPRSQRTYRLLQIAISMLVDHDLHQADDVREDHAETQLQDPRLEPRISTSLQVSREDIRASLGCFYLSSVLVQVPSPIEHLDTDSIW